MDVDEVVPEDGSMKERRYLGISEFAPENTCMASSMGANWPFDAEYDGDCALKQAKFHSLDGYATYYYKWSPASLLAD